MLHGKSTIYLAGIYLFKVNIETPEQERDSNNRFFPMKFF